MNVSDNPAESMKTASPDGYGPVQAFLLTVDVDVGAGLLTDGVDVASASSNDAGD